MKAIQVTLEQSMLREIDRSLGGRRRRSAFIRECVRLELERRRIALIEEAEREAYRRKPIRKGEFDVWDGVQIWGEE